MNSGRLMMLDEIVESTDWRAAIGKYEKRDFYHSWCYHDAEGRLNGAQPVLLERRFGSEGGVALPILLRKITVWGRSTVDATSVYGYPGPLVRGNVSEADLRDWALDVKGWLEQKGCIALFSRLNPLLDNSLVAGLLGDIEKVGETVSIDLGQPLEEQRSQFRATTRNEIGKLVRMGATCDSGTSELYLKEFIRLYEITMNRIGAAKRYFFPTIYYRALLDSDEFDARIYSVKIDGKTVAAGLFVFSGHIVQYHLGGSDPDYKKVAPSKLLFEKVRHDFTGHGARWLHLGGGVGGEDDSLLRFKTGFSKRKQWFSVLKLVVNREEYDELSRLQTQNLGVTDGDYFPSYLYKALDS